MSTTSPLQQSAQILLNAKEDITVLLKGTEHEMTLLTVDAQLNNLVNRLSFLTGASVQTVVKNDFPPVTNFFGDELKLPKQVTKEDLTPEMEQMETYRAKVKRLYSEFDTIAPEGILNAYTIPEDVAVLRGVAKVAGVEGFEEREINVKFIEDISKAIKRKAADELEQKRIEEELSKQQGGQIANTKPLTQWSNKELQAELTRLNVAFESDANKKTLIELLENSEKK